MLPALRPKRERVRVGLRVYVRVRLFPTLRPITTSTVYLSVRVRVKC